jgi:Fe2+ transport system protein B
MIIVLNKIDVFEENLIKKIVAKFNKKIKNKLSVIPISAVKKQNLDLLIKKIIYFLNKKEKTEIESIQSTQEPESFIYESDNIIVEKQQNKFVVKGKKIEELVQKTNFSLEESVERLQRIFKKLGIEKLLKKKGIKPGDKVVIAGFEFEYYE